MRVVLYTDDMEPITVIELTPFAYRHLMKTGNVILPVLILPSTMVAKEKPSQEYLKTVKIKAVKIKAEIFIRNGNEHMMLFTNDEESAMLLKCAFLPGQQAGVNKIAMDNFAKVFLAALYRLGE